MAYTTINKSTAHFNTKLYTGNAGTQSITGVGFQPDMVWLKKRSASGSHYITDAVRGVGKALFPDATNAEYNYSDGVTAFGTDGWTVGNNGGMNGSSTTQVSWNWKANGQGSSNTDGSINTTYTSANTTAGFSIVKYQGTGANATVGHGLGAVPKMIFFKSLTNAISWIVYSSELNISSSNCLRLNGTNAAFTESAWNGTRPTTSVFSLGTHNEANNSSGETIAYCFAEKKGYSKFGSYTGNGNADGTFVYTGFKPAFVMWKKTNAASEWIMVDSKRNTSNEVDKLLRANQSSAENTYGACDFLSNGWKFRDGDTDFQASGDTYIYMAFAENPFVTSTGVPGTAR